MRAVFRTDASPQIGTGHVMRCLTLADVLRKQGVVCQFVCRTHEGHLVDQIRARGYVVHALPKQQLSGKFPSDLTHGSWLGADWQTDADQTRQALASEALDWLIVDHYALDHRWETALRSSCKHIMVIDDLADRRHDCDVFLDQNYGSSIDDYHSFLPINCERYFGPRYALLNPIYAERRNQLPSRNGKIRRVMIYFGGGTDKFDLMKAMVDVFGHPELIKIELEIVFNSKFERYQYLQERLLERGHFTVHHDLPHLADLFAHSDVAIGAAGSATWERCCLKLPSILIETALNQKKIGAEMKKAKSAIVLYPGKNIVQQVTAQFLTLLENKKMYRDMSAKAGAICDGLGVFRTASKIINFKDQ